MTTRRMVKVDYRSTSKEAYNKFVEDTKMEIDFKTWKKVLCDFNDGVVNHLIDTGEKVDFIHGLGQIHIQKARGKFKEIILNGKKIRVGLSIDWAETKKQGTYVYHKNYHTDGYKCYYNWSPYSARFFNSQCWMFKPSRFASRTLAAKLKTSNAGYLIERYREKIKN